MKRFRPAIGLVLFGLMLLCAPASMAWPTLTFRFDGQQKKGLNAKATAHGVQLNWTQGAPVTGSTCTGGGSTAITGNAVFRGSTAGGEGTTALITFTTPTVSYLDSAVTAGSSYYYYVTAINCNGSSGPSNEVGPEVIPNNAVPNPPTGLTGSAS
jgi:hypothetical protein